MGNVHVALNEDFSMVEISVWKSEYAFGKQFYRKNPFEINTVNFGPDLSIVVKRFGLLNGKLNTNGRVFGIVNLNWLF